MSYVYLSLITVFSFFAAVMAYAYGRNWLLAISPSSKVENFVFFPFLIVCAPIFFGAFFLLSENQDMLFSVSLLQICVVWAGGALIACTGFLQKKLFLPVAVVISCVVGTFLLPSDFLLCSGVLPFWLDRAATLAAWISLVCGFGIFGKTEGLTTVIGSILCGGIILYYILALSSFESAVMFTAMLGVFIAFMFFNWAPSEIYINVASSCAIGFIMGWLFLVLSGEGMELSALILLTYVAIELIFYTVTHIVFLKKASKSSADATDMDKRQDGNADAECRQAGRIQFLLVIFSLMQAFAVKSWSLLIFSAIFVLWATARLGLDPKKEKLSDINRRFIADIKNNIKDFFNTPDKND